MVAWITEACGWAVRALTDFLTGGAAEIFWTGLDICHAIQEARSIYRRMKHGSQIGYDLYHFLHDHKHIHGHPVERLEHHHRPRIGMPRRKVPAQQFERMFDNLRPREQEFRAAMQFHRPRRQQQYPQYQSEIGFQPPTARQPQYRVGRQQSGQRRKPAFEPQRRHDEGCAIC